jgi:hypothetical protein
MSEPRFDVTTLGEMLIRLSVPSGKRIENTTQLEVYPAGAEANVVCLHAWKEKTCWFGALPRIRLDGWQSMPCESQAWISGVSVGTKAAHGHVLRGVW